MNTYNSLVDMLKLQKNNGITFIYSKHEEYLSYPELFNESMHVLGGLQRMGVKVGDEVIFQINDNKTFLILFWACLIGKIIPVPISIGNGKEEIIKVFEVWLQMSNPYLIYNNDSLEKNERFSRDSEEYGDVIDNIKKKSIHWDDIDKLSEGIEESIEECDIAFVQFSSGSTSTPKGVTLTHRNLLENIKAISKGAEITVDDILVTWMPLTHDMGLIGMHLCPLAWGMMQYNLSPMLFVQRPFLWLDTVSKYKATLISSPNFGFQYINERLDKRKPDHEWDLSKVRVIFNGAEPISYEICNLFLKNMEVFGLSESSMFPVYGMAEASLAISFPRVEEKMIPVKLDRRHLSIGDCVHECTQEDENAAVFVDVGYPIDSCNVKIADNNDSLVEERIVGNILITGASVTSYYYNRNDLTETLFDSDGWLRTGDVGFIQNNRLVIIGRVKDMLIVNGMNYYCVDLERIVLKGLGDNNVEVTVCGNGEGSNYELIVFLKYRKPISEFIKMLSAIRKAIYEEVHLKVEHIIPVKSFPKTTSGKIQRYKLYNSYKKGEYAEIIQKTREEIEKQKVNKEIVKPSNEVEEGVKRIIEAVISVEGLSVTEDLHLYGISSVQVGVIYDDLSEGFEGKIQIADLFSLNTIRKIADKIIQGDKEIKDLEISHRDIKDNDKGYGINEKKVQENSEINQTDQTDQIDQIDQIDQKKDIAIIGMSIRMPMADSIEEYWENIRSGLDCTSSLPKRRSDEISPYLDYKLGHTNRKTITASFMENISDFDYSFFGISPKEAKLMDPLQRLLLQNIFETIEDSGYSKESLGESDTGIFMGMIGDIDKLTYRSMIWENDVSDSPMALTGNLLSMIPGKVAYRLNLKGPAMVIDTACSSSLVAVHEACQAIRNKECNMAIVASGRIHTFPITDGNKIGIESDDSCTRTFDYEADGSGFGEGIASIFLKPLDKAIEDHDNVYAVIKGSAVGQDGASKDVTAPNPKAQEQVICRAWEAARVNPENISYIECHGTATKLGDPIEVDALDNAFSRYTDKKQFCAIGSVKSNMGHLLECAGIAGIIKCVLAMNQKEIPPTIHFQQPNKRISFISSSVYVNKALQHWQQEELLCGVSSFGLSGVNCHMILGEAPKLQGKAREKGGWDVFTLSAKTPRSLREFAIRYRSFVKKTEEDLLHQICYTTNTGKDQYRYRLAMCINSRSELINKLDLLINDGFEDRPELEIWCNAEFTETIRATKAIEAIDPREKKATNESKSVPGDTDKSSWKSYERCLSLCMKYVDGINIDWIGWYGEKKIQKVSVPTYPFDKAQMWVQWQQKEMKSGPNDLDEDYFYNIKWVQKDLSGKNMVSLSGKKIILFHDGNIEINHFVNKLSRQGMEIIEAILDKEFCVESRHRIHITNNKDGYHRLFDYVHDPVDCMIHAVNMLERNTIHERKDLEERMNKGFYSLLYLAKEIGHRREKKVTDVVLLSNCAYEVTGLESMLQPHNAAFLGLGKNINLEFSNCKCRAIDIDDSTDLPTIIDHIMNNDNKYVTALRQNKAYYEEFVKEQIDTAEGEKFCIKEKGVYLITGGLGRIGLETAKYIASQAKANIIFLNRKGFPDRCDWDRRKTTNTEKLMISKLLELERMGSNCHIYQSDVSEETSISGTIHNIIDRFGVIDGVFHGAGVTGNGYIINRDEKDIREVLAPKVYGTWLLDKYLCNQKLDFFVMYSSGVSMIGEIGLADYTAANSYLDSFAKSRGRSKRTLSIDWVVWKDARMGDGNSKNVDGIFKPIEAKRAIQCLDLVLRCKIKQVLIGCLDYSSQFLENVDSIPFMISDSIRNKINVREDKQKSHKAVEVNERIRLGEMTYSAVERQLSAIVGNMLEIEEINIHDNFFELGVSSIILNKIYGEICKVYPDKLMISDMFAYSSIHKLGRFIMEQEEAKNKEAKTRGTKNNMDDIIDKIKTMDEIDDLLEQL